MNESRINNVKSNVKKNKFVNAQCACRVALAILIFLLFYTGSTRTTQSETLKIFSWGGYDLPGEEIFAEFTNRTGVEMRFQLYSSSDEAFAVLKSGAIDEFDVIILDVRDAPRFFKEGLIQSINEGRLPLDRIHPSIFAKSKVIGSQQGQSLIAIPYFWGAMGILAAPSFKPMMAEENSYKKIWDGSGERVAISKRSVLFAGLLSLAHVNGKSLAWVSSNFEDRGTFVRTFDDVLEHIHQAQWPKIYVEYPFSEVLVAVENGDADRGLIYDSSAYNLLKERPEYEFYSPQEGGVGWMDGIAIVSGSSHPELAYGLIEYLMSPEISGKYSGSVGQWGSILGFEDHIFDEMRRFFDRVYSDDAIDRIWFEPKEPSWFFEEWPRIVVQCCGRP